jgi:hypothetical protein
MVVMLNHVSIAIHIQSAFEVLATPFVLDSEGPQIQLFCLGGALLN